MSEPRIVPMPTHLEPDVRDVYADCHPGWAPVSEHWFYAHPTLVAIDDQKHVVVGYTSYTIGERGMYLEDTCVVPWARNCGLGRRLMAARLAIAKSLGISTVFGVTQPDNVAMRRILADSGFKEVLAVPGAYTQASPIVDGLIYALEL